AEGGHGRAGPPRAGGPGHGAARGLSAGRRRSRGVGGGPGISPEAAMTFAVEHPTAVLAMFVAAVHALGLVSALHALVHCRTSTAAIAWAISLFTFPWLTLPLYWTVGRDRFYGYIQALRAGQL